MAYVAAVAVMVIWGTTFVSSKVVLMAGVSPSALFVLRFSIAYVAMCIVSHRRLWADSLIDELLFALMGLTGVSVYFLTENMALRLTQASNVAILVCSCPLWTALLVGAVYSRERMRARQIAGSLLAFMGMALVVLNGQLVLHLSPAGDALALAAAGSWTVYSLLMTRQQERYHSDFITRKVFAYGLISVVPLTLLAPLEGLNAPTLLQPVVLGNVLYLSLIASSGAYLLWNWELRRLGTVRASTFIYGQPLVAIAFGVALLGERFTPMGALGSVVLLVGIWLAFRKQKAI